MATELKRVTSEFPITTAAMKLYEEIYPKSKGADRFNKSIEDLNAAIEQGGLRKSALAELRQDLTRSMEETYKKQISEKYFYGGKIEEQPQAIQDAYYSSFSFQSLNKFERELKPLSDHPCANDVLALINEWRPVKDALEALKDHIITPAKEKERKERVKVESFNARVSPLAVNVIAEALEKHKPQLQAEFVAYLDKVRERVLTARQEQKDDPDRKWSANVRQWRRENEDTLRQYTHAGSTDLDIAKVTDAAVKHADATCEQWHRKLCLKIGAGAENIDITHFDGTDMYLRFKSNGHDASIRQQRIVNTSTKGNLFYQYPSRITVDGKGVSEHEWHTLLGSDSKQYEADIAESKDDVVLADEANAEAGTSTNNETLPDTEMSTDAMKFDSYKAITASPEIHAEFLKQLRSVAETMPSDTNLAEHLKRNVQIGDKGFSQVDHLTSLEMNSDDWDLDETAQEVKIELARHAIALKTFDTGYDIQHFIQGFPRVMVDLEASGALAEANAVAEAKNEEVVKLEPDNITVSEDLSVELIGLRDTLRRITRENTDLKLDGAWLALPVSAIVKDSAVGSLHLFATDKGVFAHTDPSHEIKPINPHQSVKWESITPNEGDAIKGNETLRLLSENPKLIAAAKRLLDNRLDKLAKEGLVLESAINRNLTVRAAQGDPAAMAVFATENSDKPVLLIGHRNESGEGVYVSAPAKIDALSRDQVMQLREANAQMPEYEGEDGRFFHGITDPQTSMRVLIAKGEHKKIADKMGLDLTATSSLNVTQSM